MALITRLFPLSPGALIKSADLNSEFNQLINLVSGVSTSKHALFKFSDAAIAPLNADQLGAGPIAEFFQAGTVKARVTGTGQFQSLTTTGTAPLLVASTTVVTNLNADTVDGIDGADIAKVSTHKTAFSFGWFYPTPPAAVEGTQSVHDFSVPDGNEITVTKLKIIRTGGSHTAATVLTFTVFRRASDGSSLADLGTISLNDTNNTSGVTYTNDIGDVQLNAGDRLSVILTTRTGTPTETQITVLIIGKQKLTT